MFSKKVFKISLYVIASLFIICALIASTGYLLLRGSLPQLDGEAKIANMSAPAIIERDALGIPSIRAGNRLDIARALGFLHAQDRLFQMDLLRRMAAGELSELFGKAALEIDKKRRLHQFRKKSIELLSRLEKDEIELLHAYTDGVNAGIDSLQVRPFEYLLLQQQPNNWKPEDTLLVSYALFIELQEEDGVADTSRGYMKALLPEEVYHFFVDNGSVWEAALDDSKRPILPIPAKEQFAYLEKYDAKKQITTSDITDILPLGGSNNWAIMGSRTVCRKALIACDMHLKLAVPNIWYRSTFSYLDDDGIEVHVTGATLPGTPCMIIGSNKHIAWGWTNAYVDTTDLVILEDTSNFPTEVEEIIVKGENPVSFEIQKTPWGPVSLQKFLGKPVAIQWVAHLPDALNLRLMDLETVLTTKEALEAIKAIRIPVLNFVVGDSDGHIAWTLAGAMPKRVGTDGTVPETYQKGVREWNGAEDVQLYPVVYDPAQESVWTANNRFLGSDSKIPLNHEGYLNGIRSYQIKNKLLDLQNTTAQDMLDLQLDTSGTFFERWQNLLLELLQKAPVEPRLTALKDAVASWDKHASTDSAGYYWIRRFRALASQHLLARFLHPCFEAWPDFAHIKRDFEEPIWMIVNQKPDYLINPVFGSWDNELLAYVNEMLDKDVKDSEPIQNITWGKETLLQMQHPFSKVIPMLQPYLDMPKQSLPGDYYMPRLAGPQAGASQRMVVSPGDEEHGIYHAPGGQCGHPLSPHYSDCHDAWVKGLPTPFLPGKTIHTLTLTSAN